MRLLTDEQLLGEYVSAGDADALGELIRRRIGGVYSAALRQVRDEHLAQDVTQAVFILLARKASLVRPEAALGGWLFGVTRFAARNAMRMEARRKHHERQAAEEIMRNWGGGQAADNDDELIPLLDEAIESLPRRDRTGVIMSFFERQTYRQIGQVIGGSEEAARKRVMRSVERMRAFFAARGVTAGAAAISVCLSKQAEAHAPAHLTESTVRLLALSNVAPAGGSAAAIAKGVTHMWMLAKMKIAAAVTGAALVGGLAAAEAARQPAAPSASTPVVHLSNLAGGGHEAKLESGIVIRFIGLCKTADEKWFDFAGQPIGDPSSRFGDMNFRQQQQYHAVLRIDGGDQPMLGVDVTGVEDVLFYDLDDGANAKDVLLRFTLPDGQKSADMQVSVADGDWQPLATSEHHAGRPVRQQVTPEGGFAFTHVSEMDGGSVIYVATDCKHDAWTLFAVDNTGQEHFCRNISTNQVSTFTATRFEYDVPVDRIASFAVKVRPYTSRITVKGMAMRADEKTQPQISVEKLPQPK